MQPSGITSVTADFELPAVAHHNTVGPRRPSRESQRSGIALASDAASYHIREIAWCPLCWAPWRLCARAALETLAGVFLSPGEGFRV